MDNNDVVIITLDRPRELKLRHKTLKRYLAKHNISMEFLDSALQDYDMLIDLIFEMLHADDPSLTPDQCDDLLDIIPLGEVMKKATEAIRAAFSALPKSENPTMATAPENGTTGQNS